MTQRRFQTKLDEIPLALLAGGMATRFRSVTDNQTPKAMVQVAGRPFIDHQLELFQRRGIRRAVICLGHLGKKIEHHVGDGHKFGLEVSYSYDTPSLLGTGGAIRRALPLLGELFWVVYGDSYVDIQFSQVLDAFLAGDQLGLMTVIENDNQWDKSNVEYTDGKLVRYDKRNRTSAMRHIDYGVGLLRKSAAQRIPPAVPYDLADLYSMLVAEERMMGFEVTDRFYEIGTPESLEETRGYLQPQQGQLSNE